VFFRVDLQVVENGFIVTVFNSELQEQSSYVFDSVDSLRKFIASTYREIFGWFRNGEEKIGDTGTAKVGGIRSDSSDDSESGVRSTSTGDANN